MADPADVFDDVNRERTNHPEMRNVQVEYAGKRPTAGGAVPHGYTTLGHLSAEWSGERVLAFAVSGSGEVTCWLSREPVTDPRVIAAARELRDALKRGEYNALAALEQRYKLGAEAASIPVPDWLGDTRDDEPSVTLDDQALDGMLVAVKGNPSVSRLLIVFDADAGPEPFLDIE